MNARKSGALSRRMKRIGKCTLPSQKSRYSDYCLTERHLVSHVQTPFELM